MATKRMAEIGFSEEYGRMELVLPHGTKFAELGKYGEKLFGDMLARLPRGCQACLSGHDFHIRERLENVLQIDLEKMEVLDRK